MTSVNDLCAALRRIVPTPWRVGWDYTGGGCHHIEIYRADADGRPFGTYIAVTGSGVEFGDVYGAEEIDGPIYGGLANHMVGVYTSPDMSTCRADYSVDGLEQIGAAVLLAIGTVGA